MIPRRRFLPFWIGLGLTVGVALAQERGPSEPGAHPSRPIERLRERLRARPEAERTRLEHYLDEFEKLPREKRAKLLERARVLRERERSFDPDLSREPATSVQDDPEQPSGEHAGELRHARLREGFRACGRELRTRLPEEVRRRLEKAPPEVRRRFLERLLQDERISRKALAKMCERHHLQPDEVQRLEHLPLPERLRGMRELGRGRHGRGER